jgi:hypothetical protein
VWGILPPPRGGQPLHLIYALGVLLLWFAFFLFARDWMRGVHGKWFNIPPDRFDEIHYVMMGFYELTIFVVLLGPYLALRIVGAP